MSAGVQGEGPRTKHGKASVDNLGIGGEDLVAPPRHTLDHGDQGRDGEQHTHADDKGGGTRLLELLEHSPAGGDLSNDGADGTHLHRRRSVCG